MIEKRFRTVEQVEMLHAWMAAPPDQKPTLPFDAEPYLRRLQLAHTWLLQQGGSKKKVWPMLLAHYKELGIPYSEATARRDVDDAMRLFHSVGRHLTRWTAEFMLNALLERYDSAARAHRDTECARLAREIRGYLELIDKYVAEDAERLTEPIPVLAVFDLQEANIKPDPNIREKVRAYLAARYPDRPLIPPDAEDAQPG